MKDYTKLLQTIQESQLKEGYYISFDFTTKHKDGLDLFFMNEYGIQESIYFNDDESTPEIEIEKAYLLIKKYSK
jgi:hypothetical protein